MSNCTASSCELLTEKFVVFVKELVSQVFDRVAQYLQGMPGPGSDAAVFGAHVARDSGLCGERDGKTGGREGCHAFILALFFGQVFPIFRLRTYCLPEMRRNRFVTEMGITETSLWLIAATIKF